MSNKNTFVEFSIRIPVNLNEKLLAEAIRQNRKKNNQVNFILEKFFEALEAAELVAAKNEVVLMES